MIKEYKGYQIQPHGSFNLKVIKAIGKGSVHLTLRGMYTNSREAELAIDIFVEGQSNGKTKKSIRV